MSVKGAYNLDEFEQYLNDVEEGKAEAKFFNRKIFKAAMIALVQLEIMIFFVAAEFVQHEPPLFGWMEWGLDINWQLWWNAQILEIVPVINAGFNATTNFKMRRMRNALVQENKKIIAAKDTQIGALQQQIDAQNYLIDQQRKKLDDQAILHEALSNATSEAELWVIQKMIERGLDEPDDVSVSGENELVPEETIIEPVVEPDEETGEDNNMLDDSG